jgi:hypothetical protein
VVPIVIVVAIVVAIVMVRWSSSFRSAAVYWRRRRRRDVGIIVTAPVSAIRLPDTLTPAVAVMLASASTLPEPGAGPERRQLPTCPRPSPLHAPAFQHDRRVLVR